MKNCMIKNQNQQKIHDVSNIEKFDLNHDESGSVEDYSNYINNSKYVKKVRIPEDILFRL